MMFSSSTLLSGVLALASTSLAVSFTPTDAVHPGFQCNYPDLSGWEACNDKDSRDCWLKKGGYGSPFKGKDILNIDTDYESITPPGVTREYWLTLAEFNGTFAPDNYIKDRAKLFNATYPGPVIEACWGDQLVVHVKNELPDNGTTIHWHGIRQLGSTEMDGVNAITQCPIALHDTYTYNFTLTQYGISWYHSHYSLQYGDGAAGPLLIHGPTSENWDEAVDPLLMADWIHPTAFSLMHNEYTANSSAFLPKADSVVLNGFGRYKCKATDPNCVIGDNKNKPVETVFQKGKKYLFRLINGSVDSFFNFSIDGHKFKIITSDFVAVHPVDMDNVMLGIGQRYSIVVEALSDTDVTDFWMRVRPAPNCSSYHDASITETNQKLGVVRYDEVSTAEPTTSENKDVDVACHDDSWRLSPIVPWQIDTVPVNQDYQNNFTFFAGLDPNATDVPPGNVGHWSLTDAPMRLEFDRPTIEHLDQHDWNRLTAEVDLDYDQSGFIYMVISANQVNPISEEPSLNVLVKTAIPAGHPIHLHGHDFAIVGQETTPYDKIESPKGWNFTNPPRRDVALLPQGGYLAIAFKPDNPGIWLMHCHIAWHASSGLALQLIEKQGEILSRIDHYEAVGDGCDNWEKWGLKYDQDDSGI